MFLLCLQSDSVPTTLENHKYSRQRGQATPGSEADFLPFVLAGSMLCSGLSTAGGSPRTRACRIPGGRVRSAELTPRSTGNGSPSCSAHSQYAALRPPKPVTYCKIWKGRRENFQPSFGADTPRKGKPEVMPGTCQQPITYRPQLPSRFHCNENINSRTSIYRS